MHVTEVRYAMAHTPEWLKRSGIAVLAVLWLVHGYSYLFVSDDRRWAPEVAGTLFVCAGVFTLIVAWAPSWRLAFRLAACFTSTALVARLASVVVGLHHSTDRDAVLISVAGAASTGVIMLLWWWFWIYEVKPWSEGHSIGRRQRRK